MAFLRVVRKPEGHFSMDGRIWIIEPLPEYADGFRAVIRADRQTVATLPPIIRFADGIERYVIGPGNMLDNFRNTNLLLDTRTVTVTPVDDRPQMDAIVLWPGVDDVQPAQGVQTPSLPVQQQPVDTPAPRPSNRPKPRPTKAAGQPSGGASERVREYLEIHPDALNTPPRQLVSKIGVGKSTIGNVQLQMKQELLEASKGQGVKL